MGRGVIRELIETKTPKVLKELPDGEGWKVHYAFFARAGFTDAARAEAGSLEASLVDLERLDVGLRRALVKRRASQEEGARIGSVLLPFPANAHIIAMSHADRNRRSMTSVRCLEDTWLWETSTWSGLYISAVVATSVALASP